MPLTYRPFITLDKKDLGVEASPDMNISETERYASVIGGVALVVGGLWRQSVPGVLLSLVGGGLIYRGISGHCHLYESIGRNTAGTERPGVPKNFGTKIEKSIVINRPPEEIFRFWRNLENLPQFMEHVRSVRVLGDKRSHWIVKAPAGADVEWDAEIINEHPNEMIAWQSLPGADVQNAGTVRFEPGPAGNDTRLRVVLEFQPPGGKIGAKVAKLFHESPEQQLDEDLRRLKQQLETGAPSAEHPSGAAAS